jgi:hypothetical protein
VAVLALAVALCGSAVAGAPAKLLKVINGSDITPRSQPANRIVKDGLKGKQIDEASLGTVPSVKHATTATSATNATSADTANTATNANTVGGETADDLKVRCRPNTSLIAAGCVETGASRATLDWTSAVFTCGQARGLPTVQQLLALHAAQPGITDTEWAGTLVNAGLSFTVNMATGTVGTDLLAGPHPYRCVGAPTNN